jgi:hypothetical protein
MDCTLWYLAIERRQLPVYCMNVMPMESDYAAGEKGAGFLRHYFYTTVFTPADVLACMAEWGNIGVDAFLQSLPLFICDLQ